MPLVRKVAHQSSAHGENSGECVAKQVLNAKLRDMNVEVRADDERAIEVLASELPIHQGAQLAGYDLLGPVPLRPGPLGPDILRRPTQARPCVVVCCVCV